MPKRRNPVQKPRSLKGRARHLIYAGAAALLAILGAVVSEEMKGGMTATIEYAKKLILHESCELRAPHKKNANMPVILLAGFLDDPHDEARKALESFLVGEGDEFDTVLSCSDFTRSKFETLNQSRENYVNSIKPEIDAVNADLVLYGAVHPTLRIDLWSGNLLGGCDWQENPTPIDLNTTTNQEVLKTTRTVLLRVITTGLVAACQRQQDSDWQVVGRIFDIVSRYIESHKSDLGDQYTNAVQPLFGLAFTRYSKSAEAAWFDRALHALELLNAAGIPKSFYEEIRAILYYRNYENSRSTDTLAKSLSFVKAAQQSGSKWDDFLIADGDTVVAALKAAALDGQQGVTPRQAAEIEQANIDTKIAINTKAIEQNANDADSYVQRARYYEKKQDYVHALADLEEAVRIDPNNAVYRNGRCWGRAIANNDLTAALSDCNESLRLRPDSANTLNSRALVEYKLGMFDQAIADYNGAYQKDQADAGSLYGLGMAKLKKGDAGGSSDIAKAQAMSSDIAKTYAGYGMN